jgi:c-di-GMP-binding flagellar brake protein YcgR
MTFKKAERRKHQRVFFTLKQGKTATLTKTENSHEPISATLLNLSEDGMALALERKHIGDLKPGDRLTIHSQEKWEPIQMLKGIELEIKYVQDYHIYINLSCGGKFTSIPPLTREKIGGWIQKRRQEEKG